MTQGEDDARCSLTVGRCAPLPARALVQVGYGISIVTFLGAVHWGLAMGSTAMASPLMRRAARESYL